MQGHVLKIQSQEKQGRTALYAEARPDNVMARCLKKQGLVLKESYLKKQGLVLKDRYLKKQGQVLKARYLKK